MELIWIENARRAFAAVYGEKRGRAVCDAVIPGVLGDFRKMLGRAAEGETVREIYRTDDRKTDVILEGRRENGSLLITWLTVGGTVVDLGGPPLKI